MDDLFLVVSELFYSIQGESTRAGLPCIFIRLSGCNLRCAYCDSEYTWEEPGRRTGLDEILTWTEKHLQAIVEITGGEPLLQENIYPLLTTLVDAHRSVLLETNGSVPVDRVPDPVSIILDIKCPDSGMDSSMHWNNLDILRERSGRGSSDEIKFVLSSQDDFYWAKNIVKKHSLDTMLPVLFSPNERGLEPSRLAALILEHELQVRLQLQLHRILWPGSNRGV